MAEKEYMGEDLERKWIQKLDKDEAEMYLRRCAICRKRQYRIALPPKEVEIEVWMWYKKCWKCGKKTPVVWTSPHSEVGGFNVNPDSFEDLIKKISEIYHFFKATYSKGRVVYGNVCIHCGAYQGNWYVWEELLEIAYEPSKIAEKRKIRFTLAEEERLQYAHPEEVLKFERHHISYDPEEIIFVCRKCHRKIHYTDDFPHLKPKSKKR